MERREDFSKHPLDQSLSAIEAGEKDKAKALVKQLWNEGRPLHDLVGDTVALLLTYIGDRLGEEAIEDVTRYMGEELWKPIFLYMKDQGPDAMAAMFATFLRAHGMDFYCEEDDEKYAFVMHYCTSGGRMIKEGKNEDSDRHPCNFGLTKSAHPWSFNKTGIPYYCCHCALCMDMQPREWGWDIMEHQFGRQFDEEGTPVDEPCKTIIYKKPQS